MTTLRSKLGILVAVVASSIVPVSFVAAGVLCVRAGCVKSAVTCFVFGLLTTSRLSINLRQ